MRRRVAAIAGAGVLALSIGMTAGLVAVGAVAEPTAEAPVAITPPWPVPVAALPVPDVQAVPPVAPCDQAGVQDAVASNDAGATIVAVGGGGTFREAVATGTLPCVNLADAAQPWFVVNKLRPFSQQDWAPSDLVTPSGLAVLDGSALRAEAASALDALAGGVRAAGAGDIAMSSGYRSYQTQVANHEAQVASEGTSAELSSARAGYSEHQTGLTADIVPCSSGCGSLDDMAASAQGRWIAEHGWEYGWIVRYEAGQTDTTGYLPEPWHLRYIGTELARAYHEGGFESLEAFFGLPAAPDYTD